MPAQETFQLKVHVDMDEYAYLTRRCRYLEACLVQVLHDRRAIKEWFSARELEAVSLPGLPRTARAIGDLARRKGWPRRKVPMPGGWGYEYHFSALPPRAFDALISRVLDVPQPAIDYDPAPVPELPPAERHVPDSDPIGTLTPEWALPLLRVVRGDRPVSIDAALRELAHTLPVSIRLPNADEAARYLDSIGVDRDRTST